MCTYVFSLLYIMAGGGDPPPQSIPERVKARLTLLTLFWMCISLEGSKRLTLLYYSTDKSSIDLGIESLQFHQLVHIEEFKTPKES